MKFIIALLFLGFSWNADAQISKVSLQASGLTCSMCSKAVKLALEEVTFVEKVQVDIKNQQYNLSFKNDAVVDLDALAKAVEDAGFSVASLKVTANVSAQKLQKDAHVKIAQQFFHFLNGENKELNGETTFTVVDKKFVPEKSFKKYTAMTKMACVKTGMMEPCCSSDAVASSRIYHVLL
jgi:copper chaperone CopZ